MFTLSNIDFSPLNEFVNHPDKHIQGFSGTFEETIKRGGPNSFVPMVTMFSNMEDIEITIQCRDYLDKDDMYKAFNEMLHYFSATKAHSFIFAMDIRQTSYSQKDPDSKKASATDALSLVFASEDSSGMLIMPYSIDDNDNVIWDTKEFNLTSLASDDPSKSYQGEIAELFYLMTHLNGPLFTAAQLLNYYNFRGYNFIFPDNAVAKSVIKVQI